MNFSDIMGMLKDPQAIAQRAEEMRLRMSAVRVVGSSGGGMVKVTLNGAMELVNVELAPEAVDPADVKMLEDLIKAAFNDATSKTRDILQNELTQGAGGFPFAGSGDTR